MFEALTKGFRSARNRLQGVAELTEENIDQALRDVRLSLLEADVEFGVVKRFLASVKEKAIGETVQTSAEVKGKKVKVGPAEKFIKICQDELESMMRFEGEPVDFLPSPQVTGIMMVGLQGAGKTTTAGKLALWLEKEKQRKVLLVAADVQRPGAIEQLQVLGERLNIPVFAIPGGRPVDICVKALDQAKKLKRDTIIFDTAGRLAIDTALMEELSEIQAKTAPKNIFLVIDAMIGQDSVKTAKTFHDRLGLSGVVLTKLDGDARGGAAISVKEVTGAAIKFAGMGEAMDKLEAFRPEGMASRILGFGDVVGLMKDFEQVVDEKKAEEDAKRMLQGRFTLDDFLEQIRTIKKMGPLKEIFEKLPMFGDAMPEGVNLDDGELKKVEAMVSSMTRDERRQVELFQKQPSRVKRVAKGSGRTDKEVVELLQKFSFMRQMMGDIGQQAGMLQRLPGMKQLAMARRLKDAVSTGGLEGNPMMAGLADSLLESVVAGDGGNPFAGMGLGAMPGMGGGPGMPGVRKKPLDKNKTKKLRQMQKKARKKSRR
ncbi:MAG: signal recognition particle protein [Sandaracinaceae bacterium]|nr:signal recognition particle protein [Sandaracinaceae bacterium]